MNPYRNNLVTFLEDNLVLSILPILLRNNLLLYTDLIIFLTLFFNTVKLKYKTSDLNQQALFSFARHIALLSIITYLRTLVQQQKQSPTSLGT